MAKVKKMKDLKRDSIDFGKTRIEPLFQSIFVPTLFSMVFASLFTVADGIFVGQGVGSDALAAINIVSPLFLLTTGISLLNMKMQMANAIFQLMIDSESFSSKCLVLPDADVVRLEIKAASKITSVPRKTRSVPSRV